MAHLKLKGYRELIVVWGFGVLGFTVQGAYCGHCPDVYSSFVLRVGL